MIRVKARIWFGRRRGSSEGRKVTTDADIKRPIGRPFLVNFVLILFSLAAVRIAALRELCPVANHRVGKSLLVLLVGSKCWNPKCAQVEQVLELDAMSSTQWEAKRRQRCRQKRRERRRFLIVELIRIYRHVV